jgi:hypothetical protein
VQEQCQMLQTGRERFIGLLFCLVKVGKIGKKIKHYLVIIQYIVL